MIRSTPILDRSFIFGYQNAQFDPDVRLAARLAMQIGDREIQATGTSAGEYGLAAGLNFWQIPEFPPRSNFTAGFGPLEAALQIDLSQVPTGRYGYQIDSGTLRFDGGRFSGAMDSISGSIVHVNRTSSPFGAGWSLSGWEELHVTDDGSVIRFDGQGSQLLYELTDDGF